MQRQRRQRQRRQRKRQRRRQQRRQPQRAPSPPCVCRPPQWVQHTPWCNCRGRAYQHSGSSGGRGRTRRGVCEGSAGGKHTPLGHPCSGRSGRKSRLQMLHCRHWTLLLLPRQMHPHPHRSAQASAPCPYSSPACLPCQGAGHPWGSVWGHPQRQSSSPGEGL
jgi:hypothetical protein